MYEWKYHEYNWYKYDDEKKELNRSKFIKYGLERERRVGDGEEDEEGKDEEMSGARDGEGEEDDEEEDDDDDDDDWREGEGGLKKSRRNMLWISPSSFFSLTKYFSFSDLFSASIVSSFPIVNFQKALHIHTLIITYPPSDA